MKKMKTDRKILYVRLYSQTSVSILILRYAQYMLYMKELKIFNILTIS